MVPKILKFKKKAQKNISIDILNAIESNSKLLERYRSFLQQ